MIVTWTHPQISRTHIKVNQTLVIIVISREGRHESRRFDELWPIRMRSSLVG